MWRTSAILFANLGLFLAFQSIIFQLELPPPTGYSYSILAGGLFLVPVLAVVFLTSIVMSTQISKIGAKPVLLAGTVMGTLGFLLLFAANTPSQILLATPVMSFGLGCLFVSSQNLLVLTVDPRKMGLATSMNTVFRSFGSSLGAPISGSLTSTFTVWALHGYADGTPIFFSEAAKAAFRYGFLISAISFLAVFFVAIFAQEVLGKKAVIRYEPPPAAARTERGVNVFKPHHDPRARTSAFSRHRDY